MWFVRSKEAFHIFCVLRFGFQVMLRMKLSSNFHGCDVAYWITDAPHFCKAFLLFWFPFSSKSLYFTLSFFPPLLEAALWALNSLADGPQGWLLESLDIRTYYSSLTYFNNLHYLVPLTPDKTWRELKSNLTCDLQGKLIQW